MKKEELVKKITDLLKTDLDLSFLLGLKTEEVETLVAYIRDRVRPDYVDIWEDLEVISK